MLVASFLPKPSVEIFGLVQEPEATCCLEK